MVLTACHECSQQVSTEAVTCPHCGAPVESQLQSELDQFVRSFGSKLSREEQVKLRQKVANVSRMCTMALCVVAYGFFYWCWSWFGGAGVSNMESANVWFFALGATLFFYLSLRAVVEDSASGELTTVGSTVRRNVALCLLAICIVAIFTLNIRWKKPTVELQLDAESLFAENFMTACGFFMFNGMAGGLLGAAAALALLVVLRCCGIFLDDY